MSAENVAIEDRLQAAGYKTERIGDVVNVHDPVYKVIGSKLVITEWELVEIYTISDAFKFLEGRN